MPLTRGHSAHRASATGPRRLPVSRVAPYPRASTATPAPSRLPSGAPPFLASWRCIPRGQKERPLESSLPPIYSSRLLSLMVGQLGQLAEGAHSSKIPQCIALQAVHSSSPAGCETKQTRSGTRRTEGCREWAYPCSSSPAGRRAFRQAI